MATRSAVARPSGIVGMTQEDVQLLGNPYVAGGSPDRPDKQVTGGLRKTVLESRIDFEEDGSRDRRWVADVQGKYIQLTAGGNSDRPLANGTCGLAERSGGESGVKGSPLKQVGAQEDGIPRPRVRLHAVDAITLEWRKTRRIGAGLVNMGNTCFLNSVLQCLTYCPPLANYLLQEDDHIAKCKSRLTFCMMCELQRHMKRALEGTQNGAIKPSIIVENLRCIAKQFRHGSQEDAHEFLRYVVDHLTRACVATYSGNVPLDRVSKETTVIHEIFGGYHRSQVTCLECKQTSNTYDLFMDFILDIKGVQTLAQALEKSVEAETLTGDNAYECPRCRKKVRAQKRFTVHRAPKVATVQFKRFDTLGHKVSKQVSYTEKLDLRPYMSDKQGGPLIYRLFGVLVHYGHTSSSGHYYCYVKNSNNTWYHMNDQVVQETGLNRVLSHLENAYILFYVRQIPKENLVKKSASLTLSNGASVERNGHLEPSWRKSSLPKLSLTNGAPGAALRTPAPLPAERPKVSFGVRQPGEAPSPAAKRPAPGDGFVPSKTRLVPYSGNSSDTDEERKRSESRSPKVKIGASTWNVTVAEKPPPPAAVVVAEATESGAGRSVTVASRTAPAGDSAPEAGGDRPFLAPPPAERAGPGEDPAREGGAAGHSPCRDALPAPRVSAATPPAAPHLETGHGDGWAERGGENRGESAKKDARAGDATSGRSPGRGTGAEDETRRSRGERFEKFLREGGAVPPAYPANGGYGDRPSYGDHGGGPRRGDFRWKRGSRYSNYNKLKRMGFLVKNNGGYHHRREEGRYHGNPFQEAQNFRNGGGHGGGYGQEPKARFHKPNFDNRHRGGRYRRPLNRNRYSPWTI